MVRSSWWPQGPPSPRLVANTSRHLGILRNSGLVTTRRDGLYAMYRVADRPVVDGYQALRTLAESQIAEVRRLADAFFGDLDGAEPIGLTELLARSDAGDVVVVDVRPRLEYAAGHLPEAINIPLEELAQHVADFDRDATVVGYCRGPYCVLSAQAVAQLRGAGLQAKRLDGGPLEWSAAGLPLTPPSDDATLGVAPNWPSTNGHTMRLLMVINDLPYGAERIYNGLRLATNLLAKHEDAELPVFLMGDAASAER